MEDTGNIINCCRIYEELCLSRTGDLAEAVVNALLLLYTAVLRFILEVGGYFHRSLKGPGLSELTGQSPLT